VKSITKLLCEANLQAVTSRESCRIVKFTRKGTRESRAPRWRAKAMESAETLEITALKNSPVYRDLHVDKDVTGTRETLPCTANAKS
jgi:hypothetical protein